MSRSVGLALHRTGAAGRTEVLIGHMGGPFFARKDEGGWTFPKGLVDAGEDELATAEREFHEELGAPPPPGESVDLGEVKRSGKTIRLFARPGDFDASAAVSNTFELEWPRGSGRVEVFPEVDRAAWVDLDEAERLLARNQVPFVARLRAMMAP
ncbi:MAG: NUDIX domain-containing protein [Actinomycetota bacterium]